MTETKISEEVAQSQLNLLINYYEIEPEDNELIQAIDLVKSTLIKSIMRGRLEIKEEDGLQITQHLKNGDILEYQEITGEDKIEMDKHEKQGNYARMYALVGKLTKKGHITISKLKGKDSSLTEALATIFLAA